MSTEKIVVLLLVMTVNVSIVAGRSLDRSEMTESEELYQFLDQQLGDTYTDDQEKRAIPIGAIYGVISEVIGLGSAIQGILCTSTDVCSDDTITPKLDAMDAKLDKIEVDVKAIRKDVEEVWETAKRKWYFEHIDYMISERKKVLHDLKTNDKSEAAKSTRKNYIDEVLGGPGKDMYVKKALFQIPGLVISEGLIDHFYKTKLNGGLSKIEAAKSTWAFIKKLFRYQEDGYANMIFAASMKYKSDAASFDKIVSEVCTMWNKPNSATFQEACAKFPKNTIAEKEREKQMKYIFNFADLFVYPVLEVKKDCNGFKDSDQLVFHDGFLYVPQRQAGKILVVKPDTFETVKTIDLPGAQCGGKCHPFGVDIDGEHNVLAVSAHNQAEGGDSYVMMYKITGNLKQPASGLTIKHYYTMRQLQSPLDKKADVRGVAFCGGHFAYADYNGMVYVWRMDYRSDEPEPRIRERKDLAIERQNNLLYGYAEYIGCSNDDKRLVASSNRRGNPGAGGIPTGSIQSVDDLMTTADIKATKDDLQDLFVKDHRTRLNVVKGSAIDSKNNLFYTGQQYQSDGVSGIYERRHDGERRFVREWETSKPPKVKMFGLAADDSGFLYAVHQESSLGKCLHRYNVNLEIENLNV